MFLWFFFQVRESCGFLPISSFEELNNTVDNHNIDTLRSIYQVRAKNLLSQKQHLYVTCKRTCLNYQWTEIHINRIKLEIMMFLEKKLNLIFTETNLDFPLCTCESFSINLLWFLLTILKTSITWIMKCIINNNLPQMMKQFKILIGR